jgi:hypothetical protein
MLPVEAEMTGNDQATLRDRAIKRIQKKREFSAHLLAYILVNALLVIIWFSVADQGFFWPIFPIFGWGIGVVFHAWDVYRGEPSEAEIQREMNRLK